MPNMIVLSTDFGLEGPYIGQVKAVLYQEAPNCRVIDLFSDLPKYNIQASAVLLAAYSHGFPDSTVFLSIVDPGVGMPERPAVVMKVGSHWFVGPDNGLFDQLMMRDNEVQRWQIVWQPDQLSNSFHARDLFAPIAAELAQGIFPEGKLKAQSSVAVSARNRIYPYVVYIDHFGNVITGIWSDDLDTKKIVEFHGREISYARTFGEVAFGALFWYKNSSGLIEIASNCSSAAKALGASIGDTITLR